MKTWWVVWLLLVVQGPSARIHNRINAAAEKQNHSNANATRDAADIGSGEAESPPLLTYVLLLLAGVLLGCLMLCCVFAGWFVGNHSLDATQEAMEKQPVATFTAAVKSGVRRLTTVVLPEESEEEEEKGPNLRRLAILGNLYMLSENLSEKFVRSTTDFVPDQVKAEISHISSWHRSSWALLEEHDGLYLCCKSHGREKKLRLIDWNCNPPGHVEVELLQEIELESMTGEPSSPIKKKETVCDSEGEDAQRVESGGGDASDSDGSDGATALQFRSKVSFKGIPVEGKQDPTELHTFVVRCKMVSEADAEDSEGTGCLLTVLGCEEEGNCSEWVKKLTMYSNIGQRYHAAFMWKLNSAAASHLPAKDTEDSALFLGDIRNWRIRLIFLDYLHSQQSLCITYMSEKADDGRVANILVSATEGVRASIRKVSPVPVSKLASWEEENVRANVHQYHIGASGDGSIGSVQDIHLPTSLHAFEVCQQRSTGPAKYSMYAFEDVYTCENWISAMEGASRDFNHGDIDVKPVGK